MATFTSFPFTGGTVSSNPRDFTWIPISPTKVAIIYTAVFNSNARQIFAQMITFSGSSTPTFGTPCLLTSMASLTCAGLMRGAYMRDNLLIVSLPINGNNNAQPTTFSYNVVQFDAQDRFQLLSSTATVTGLTTTWNMPELTSYNGRVFSGRRTTSDTNQFHEITVDSSYVITQTLIGSTTMDATGTQTPYAQYARRAGRYWYFQVNMHATIKSTSTASVIDLQTATVYPVPAANMQTPQASPSGGRGRTVTPTGSGVLEMDFTTTNYQRYALTTGNIVVSSTAYRTAVTGGIEDIMWLDDKHAVMILNAATSYVVFASTNTTPGAISVQVFRFDDTTNTMTVSGTPKALSQTTYRENYGNYLHKIDENNIAIIGMYQIATPSTHAGYGVQIMSI